MTRSKLLSVNLLACVCVSLITPLSSSVSAADGSDSAELPAFEIGFDYTADLLSIVDGGVERGTPYLHLVRTEFSSDLHQLIGVPGGAFFVSSHWTSGGSPSEFAGDMQAVSSLDAHDTWKLYEAWVQQEMLDGGFSWLLGLYDLNSEFDLVDEAGLFVHASFGIGPDLAQSGENGPSVFPTTSVGLRLKTRPVSSVTVLLTALDGVPGDPDEHDGTHITFESGDGLFLAGEIQFYRQSDDMFKLAAGTWLYTSRTAHLHVEVDHGEVPRSRSRGGYLLGQFPVWSGGDSQSIVAFSRVGMALPEVNRLGWYAGGGVTLNNLLTSRIGNTVGLGYAAAVNGNDYKRVSEDNGSPVNDYELALELTGRFELNQYLTLQPDVQYIVNPNSDPSIDNALAAGLRFSLAF
ncbi:MAG: carbohydrate porin [candidate division Zixibacteria bacterium]|nr:carbohydrate porin [candidate division Zixibacteria bacterium]MDH4032767.1 carbohydrate porin [candidate division Zixibacteria bacterium]